MKIFGITAPFMDEDGSIGGAGAEESEVAEPTSDEGAEEIEAADLSEEEPESREPEIDDDEEDYESPSDSAFAKLRRETEALRRQNADYEKALGNFFDGDNKLVQLRAAAEGKDPEQVAAEMEAEQRALELEQQNEELSQELTDFKVKDLMTKGLSDIQKIDPTVKSLEELGDDFADYIGAGLDSVQAYYAVKAKEAKTKPVPPTPIGKVSASTPEKDFYTKEEVESMSKEDVHNHYKAIRNSMKKW